MNERNKSFAPESIPVAADQTIHTAEERLAKRCIHRKPVEDDCRECAHDLVVLTRKHGGHA